METTQKIVELRETSQVDSVTATNCFNSSESDNSKNKKTFWKRARAFFRYISLAEYRTPLFFTNKDSYKSATSGILTLFSGLALAVIFIAIFMPIFRKELYKSEIKHIKIRGEYKNGTVESCTVCRNFTVREALEYTFNGKQALIISSGTKDPKKDCNQYYVVVHISGLDFYYEESLFLDSIGCIQIIKKDDIIMFLEEEKRKNQSIPLS